MLAATKQGRGSPFLLDDLVNDVLRGQGYVARLVGQTLPVTQGGGVLDLRVPEPVTLYLTEADLRELGGLAHRQVRHLEQHREDYPEPVHLNFLGDVLCLQRPVEKARDVHHVHVSEADLEGRPGDYCPRCAAIYAEEHWPQGKPPERKAPEKAGTEDGG